MTKGNRLLILILTIGVFGIINTEMGVIGILPSIADHFNVTITKAGLLVSLLLSRSLYLDQRCHCSFQVLIVRR